MSLNISLQTISAVILLDNEGSRLYANYYQTQSPKEAKTTHTPEVNFQTVAQQLKFESSVFSKINKAHQDVLLFDNHLIAYKQSNDIVLIIVAKINENESLVFSLVSNMFESLNILLENTIDKSTVLKKYDMVSLAIDETIDDGIIIEIEPAIIVSRVTNPPNPNATHGIEINEKSFYSALSFATKLGERLQQGL